jgi:hypothetical protein
MSSRSQRDAKCSETDARHSGIVASLEIATVRNRRCTAPREAWIVSIGERDPAIELRAYLVATGAEPTWLIRPQMTFVTHFGHRPPNFAAPRTEMAHNMPVLAPSGR